MVLGPPLAFNPLFSLLAQSDSPSIQYSLHSYSFPSSLSCHQQKRRRKGGGGSLIDGSIAVGGGGTTAHGSDGVGQSPDRRVKAFLGQNNRANKAKKVKINPTRTRLISSPGPSLARRVLSSDGGGKTEGGRGSLIAAHSGFFFLPCKSPPQEPFTFNSSIMLRKHWGIEMLGILQVRAGK